MTEATTTIEDWRGMETDQLRDARNTRLAAIIDIGGQLEFAEIRKRKGESIDEEWLIKATTAKRHASRELQIIEQLLAGHGSSKREKYFTRVARRLLDRDLFQELWDQAKDEAAGKNRQRGSDE